MSTDTPSTTEPASTEHRDLTGPKPRRGRWLAAVAVATVIPTAFLAGLMAAEDRLEGVTVEPTPVVAPARAITLTDEHRTRIALTWQEGTALLAPAWTGLVTAVHAAPGERLTTGDAVASVDGVVRLAALTEEPLHRRLAAGDTGRDVAMLHDLLARLGHLERLPADPERFTWVTRVAVRELERALGVPRPAGALDPSWLVRLPSEPWAVSDVALEVGRPAPPVGEAVATGPRTLVRAGLANADGGLLDLDPGVAWVVEVDDAPDVALAVDAVTATISAGDLPRLAELVPAGAETVTGRIRWRQPREVVIVPSSAVATGGDGRLCVWTPEGQGFAAVGVEAVGARAGATQLAPDPALPGDVLANPAEILEQPACPSR